MKQITLQTIQEYNLFKALAEKEHAPISDILEFHTLTFPLTISVSSSFAERYGY